MKRREFLGSATLAAAGLVVVARGARGADLGVVAQAPAMTVYKSASCGCCKEWVKHVEQAGFAVKSIDINDLTQVKRDAGVPTDLESCHTALAGSYVFEGHVPADLVKKVLAEKPQILGLAVPGMPIGSPGMEQGAMKQPYNVVAFSKGGKTSIYARR